MTHSPQSRQLRVTDDGENIITSPGLKEALTLIRLELKKIRLQLVKQTGVNPTDVEAEEA